ncbi:unnamed protein product [Dibothriocephalus latus]|uniref:Uncharacterized protein n=1 Tax=Dibothriocephalus latus TaxID=60516 RepID=A0A3P7NBD0_DIBLA|nr:unnamed protein product [Dibothriocephalus latus]
MTEATSDTPESRIEEDRKLFKEYLKSLLKGEEKVEILKAFRMGRITESKDEQRQPRPLKVVPKTGFFPHRAGEIEVTQSRTPQEMRTRREQSPNSERGDHACPEVTSLEKADNNNSLVGMDNSPSPSVPTAPCMPSHARCKRLHNVVTKSKLSFLHTDAQTLPSKIDKL